MNICLYNDSFPPLIDGVANTVVNYAAVIQNKYGNALVATPKYPGVTDNFPFEVLRYASINTKKLVGYRTGYPFDALAVRRMKDFMPDLLHAHCPMASLFMAREMRSLTGAPIILTYHTKFDIDIKRAIKIGSLSDVAIRTVVQNIESADEVWAVNQGAGDNLKSLGFNGNIRIMPNGVEFPRGAASDTAQKAVSNEFGIPEGCRIFLFVGRMLWYKGQKIILDGLRRVKEAGETFCMVFVGDGDNLDDIKKYAAELSLEKECIFTGAIRDRDRLRALYSRANMFLLPSVFDNNPIVVKEAAACKTASVLIAGSSSAEGVTDGKNGLTIAENSDDMSRTLLALCRDAELSRRLGENALNDLYASWEDRIDSAVSRYREVIELKQSNELPPPRAKLDWAIDTIREIQIGFDKVRDYFTGTGDIF